MLSHFLTADFCEFVLAERLDKHFQPGRAVRNSQLAEEKRHALWNCKETCSPSLRSVSQGIRPSRKGGNIRVSSAIPAHLIPLVPLGYARCKEEAEQWWQQRSQ